MESAVILTSGGINSTVAAAWARQEAEVHLLHADWGQPAAARERSAVQAMAAALQAHQTLTINVSHPAQIEAAARPGPRKELTTTDESLTYLREAPGVLPVLLWAGVHWAVRLGASRVICGASQVADEQEHEALPDEGRPDRRVEFFHVFNMMLESALPRRRKLMVETPLIDMTREEIVRLGTRFDAPLQFTWSCDLDEETPCGRCLGCRTRAKAFGAAGLATPP